MKTIWKFQLSDVSLQQAISMPKGARILCAQAQHGFITIWAEVDVTRPAVERRVHLCLTGQDLPSSAGDFIGTIQYREGSYVAHVYIQPERL